MGVREPGGTFVVEIGERAFREFSFCDSSVWLNSSDHQRDSVKGFYDYFFVICPATERWRAAVISISAEAGISA